MIFKHTTSRNIIVQVNNCGFRVFPNPSLSVIAVEFEEPDRLESIPDEITLIDKKTQKTVKSKDLKTLKSNKQTASYPKTEFDVSALPGEVYYLHLKFDEKLQRQIEQVRILSTN